MMEQKAMILYIITLNVCASHIIYILNLELILAQRFLGNAEELEGRLAQPMGTQKEQTKSQSASKLAMCSPSV